MKKLIFPLSLALLSGFLVFLILSRIPEYRADRQIQKFQDEIVSFSGFMELEDLSPGLKKMSGSQGGLIYTVILDQNNELAAVGTMGDEKIKADIRQSSQLESVRSDFQADPMSYIFSVSFPRGKLSSGKEFFCRFLKVSPFSMLLVFQKKSISCRVAVSGITAFILFIFLLIFKPVRKTKVRKKQIPKKITGRLKKKNNEKETRLRQIDQWGKQKLDLEKQNDQLSFFREVTLATTKLADLPVVLNEILEVLRRGFTDHNIIIYLYRQNQTQNGFYPERGIIDKKILDRNGLEEIGYSEPENIDPQELLERKEWDGLSILPLKDEEEPLGFIAFEGQNGMEKLDSGEQNFIARQLGMVIRNAHLYEMAITDGLTGLFLHRYFQIRLNEEMSRSQRYGRPLSLALMDIDNFKTFNDEYGHQTGDFVLRALSQLIRDLIRNTDMAFRYGGEEMVVLMTETNMENAYGVAEKIRRGIENEEFEFEGKLLRVTVSVGVGTCKSGENKKDFIERCDQAMYRAKKTGKNRVIRADQED